MYEETEDGVRAGVSKAEADEVRPGIFEPLLMAPALLMLPEPKPWLLGGLLLDRYWLWLLPKP